MQSTSAPAKFLIPFAANDSAKVEIPVTTVDATRASQSLGFPPLTMQPPEVGGVPPQGEDFNGAMNQVARAAWWVMLGSLFVYDSTFATNVNIGGYPKGSQLLRTDLAGLWLNGAENNSTNPDDNTGAAANWLPGYTYGSASIAVSTATTVYPVNAAHKTLYLTGTLTANSVVNLPAWTYEWLIIDNTVRAGFTLTVKTASGTGIVIATGAQRLRGDGTNIIQPAESIAAATIATQAAQAGQVASGALITATAGGTANAITASFAASPAAYATGQPFTIISAATNTGAMTAILTLGGVAQTSVSVVKGNNQPVVNGDFPVGYPGEFAYSPAFGNLVLNNPATGIGATGGGQIQGVFRNLSLSATGLSASIAMSTDAIALATAALAYKTVTGVSLTINSATVGANGLDTGTLAASTFYYVFVINNGTTTAGLLSLSATAPTLPSGYTYFARVGAIYTDSSANKYPLSFKQFGRSVQYTVTATGNVPNYRTMASGTAGSVGTPTYVAVAVGTFVPPTAGKIKLLVQAQSSNSTIISPNNATGTAQGTANPPFMSLVEASAAFQSAPCEMILENTNVYWASSGGALYCIGWEDNL